MSMYNLLESRHGTLVAREFYYAYIKKSVHPLREGITTITTRTTSYCRSSLNSLINPILNYEDEGMYSY